MLRTKIDQGKIVVEHCPNGQMWTRINTKPKQGTIFQVFRGHVMAIPTDYNDSNFRYLCQFKPPDFIPKPVLILPIPKDWVASQECVGANAKLPEQTPNLLTHASGNVCVSRCSVHTLAADRPKKRVQLAVDMAVLVLPDEPQQAPLIMVSRRAWSLGLY